MASRRTIPAPGAAPGSDAGAAMAIENARLVAELHEALAQQTAAAEVLQVINASSGQLAPVFDAMLEKAMRLCEADFGLLSTFDGRRFHSAANRAIPAAFAAYRAQNPPDYGPDTAPARLRAGERIVHSLDMMADAAYQRGEPNRRAIVDLGGARTALTVALRNDDTLLGMIHIYRQEVRVFTDRQIALLENFAAQAVIAIENARLLGELRERTEALALRNSEFGERIEQQSATIDVLKAMSGASGDPQPVFELITRRARELCNANTASIFEYDGELMHLRTADVELDSLAADASEAFIDQFPRPPGRDLLSGRAILDRKLWRVDDITDDPEFSATLHGLGRKSFVAVPLLMDQRSVGAMILNSPNPGHFSDSQVALLETFAEQAVIAMRTAATFRELQARTAALAARNSEYGERIEQQSATIDVLKVMSCTPDDTQPVFDLITRRARELCNGTGIALFEYDGELVHIRSLSGLDQAAMTAFAALFPMRPVRGSVAGRAILERRIVHLRNVDDDPEILPEIRNLRAKTSMSLPLLHDGVPIGAISLNSLEPGGFTDSQVALLQTFAEQAVIAITSVANFRALRQRTAELTRSVAELQALEEVLRAVNSSLDLDTVLETIISRAVQLSQADEGTIYEYDVAEEVFVPKSAFGMSAERVAALRQRKIKLGETHLGRSAVLRAPVLIDDIQQDPTANAAEILPGIHAVLAVPLLRDNQVLGGLVIRRRSETPFAPAAVTLMQTFAGQSVLAIENARLFAELAARGEEASRARATAEATLTDLRRTQDRLVQAEKMASLGQLTAGIAHEIKNPLNFVNNFSDLSAELLGELNDALAPEKLTLDAGLRTEIDDLTSLLRENMQKIAEHGRRADSIVKNMLLHSRADSGERRAVDLNATVEEALNLAYHGARAQTPGFNITLEREFDAGAGSVELFPQEFIRVLLNLIGNGFYAAHKRAEQSADPGFEPRLKVTTEDFVSGIRIRVRDNGTGIPENIREKIFDPFFTTKPAGEGTGLGLSLSYDIVVKQHGGQMRVESQVNDFTEFVITLPRASQGAA